MSTRTIWFILSCMCFIVLGVFLIWLFDDEELRYSTNINDYAPVTQEGADNYEILLELSKRTLTLPHDLGSLSSYATKNDYEEYRKLLLENKVAILQNYQETLPLVEEIRALAYLPVEDNTIDFESEILRFNTMRELYRTLALRIDLYAVDHEPPFDFAPAIEAYAVVCELLPNGRVLVTTMISSVIMALLQDSFKRAIPNMSAEDKALLLAVLEKPIDYMAVLERVLYSEFCIASAIDVSEFSANDNAEFLIPMLYLKNETANTYGDFLTDFMRLAKERDIPQLELYSDQFIQDMAGFKVKNFGGRRLLLMAVPAYNKIVEQLLKNEKQREALKEEVEQSLKETVTE